MDLRCSPGKNSARPIALSGAGVIPDQRPDGTCSSLYGAYGSTGGSIVRSIWLRWSVIGGDAARECGNVR
jgi:hypothetical protein